MTVGVDIFWSTMKRSVSIRDMARKYSILESTLKSRNTLPCVHTRLPCWYRGLDHNYQHFLSDRAALAKNISLLLTSRYFSVEKKKHPDSFQFCSFAMSIQSIGTWRPYKGETRSYCTAQHKTSLESERAP